MCLKGTYTSEEKRGGLQFFRRKKGGVLIFFEEKKGGVFDFFDAKKGGSSKILTDPPPFPGGVHLNNERSLMWMSVKEDGHWMPVSHTSVTLCKQYLVLE